MPRREIGWGLGAPRKSDDGLNLRSQLPLGCRGDLSRYHFGHLGLPVRQTSHANELGRLETYRSRFLSASSDCASSDEYNLVSMNNRGGFRENTAPNNGLANRPFRSSAARSHLVPSRCCRPAAHGCRRNLTPDELRCPVLARFAPPHPPSFQAPQLVRSRSWPLKDSTAASRYTEQGCAERRRSVPCLATQVSEPNDDDVPPHAATHALPAMRTQCYGSNKQSQVRCLVPSEHATVDPLGHCLLL